MSEYCEEENYTLGQISYLNLAEEIECEFSSVVSYINDSSPSDLIKAKEHLEEVNRIFAELIKLSDSMNPEEIEID